MGTYPIRQKKVNRNEILLFLIMSVFANYFVYYFISKEEYIYFWDYYHYWAKYQNLGDLMMHSPLEAFSVIWRTVQYDDYNLLPVFFLMPFRLLFGAGRLAYIVAVTDAYVLTSALLCTILVKNLVPPRDQRESFLITLATLSTFLLFPQFWIPVLFGYPDSAGVVIIFFILLILFRKPIEEMHVKILISLGVLLAFLVLLRRYYAYWVVALFAALAATESVALFSRYRLDFKKYFPAARNLIAAGAVSVLVFVLAASPIAKIMLATDYSDIYSAYRWGGGIASFLAEIFVHLGAFISALFAVSVVSGIIQEKTRTLSILLLLDFLFVIALISRVQSFSEQHYYLILPSVIVSISLFIARMSRHMHGLPFRSLFSAAYAVILTIQFSIIFIPKAAGYFTPVAPLFPSVRHYPLVRNDLGKIRKLLDVLADKPRGSKEGVYVIASSTVFNDDILRNACTAFDYPKYFCEGIFRSSHVDKVHGFPQQFLSARHVVIAKPVQYHLRAEDQRVVGILAGEVEDAMGLGSSFERLPYEFVLDQNVEVYIYEKVKPLEKLELQDIQRRFFTYYPDKRELFMVTLKQSGESSH